MFLFYIVAAVLAALKIAGLGLALSWWVIIGIALIPLAFSLVVFVLIGVGMYVVTPKWRR
jgi:hypothetical protein